MAHPLRLDPADARPDSALGTTWLSGLAVAGGVGFTIVAPVLVSLFAGVMMLATSAISTLMEFLPDEPEITDHELLIEEEDIIEARFVTLGIDFEDELPNRIVPRLSTAPPQPSEVPTVDTPTERMERPEPQEEEPPPDAVEDVLARLGDRVQAFAEIAEERDREGSPDGIEEGTETEATEGNIYRGRLFSFFHRGWSVPTTLGPDDLEGLRTSLDVQIGENLEIVTFSVRTPSGSPLFDQSCMQQLTRLQAADQHIPPPPEEVADQYIGRRMVVRFSGRQASR